MPAAPGKANENRESIQPSGRSARRWTVERRRKTRQAKEINRVFLQCNPKGNGIDLKLIEHISPITWDNVILYGEYVLDKTKIRL